MLQVKKVSKSFGKIVALEDISFNVKPGEFVFITGKSSAGKSTLLKLVMREISPDSGEIILEDKDITKLKGKDIPKLRQKIGTVFQDFKVLPERTLRENISVALAVCGVPQDEWSDRVERVLELVDLKERMNLFPSQLSGGELQRASIARALVVNPKIILADEPTGNLDWETADSIMNLFKKINSEGKTVLMATHHQLIVKKMAGRVVQLKEGKLVQDTGAVPKNHKSSKQSEVQKGEDVGKDGTRRKQVSDNVQNDEDTQKVKVKVKDDGKMKVKDEGSDKAKE
jgi:cell division transport system ATP-binding protein